MNLQEPSLGWLYLSTKGRIGRQSFLLSIILMVLPQFWFLSQAIDAGKNTQEAAGWIMLAGFFVIATIWPTVALVIKRLHDLGFPGALALVAFVPMLNWLLFVGLVLAPGSGETNDYGPPPFGK